MKRSRFSDTQILTILKEAEDPLWGYQRQSAIKEYDKKQCPGNNFSYHEVIIAQTAGKTL